MPQSPRKASGLAPVTVTMSYRLSGAGVQGDGSALRSMQDVQSSSDYRDGYRRACDAGSSWGPSLLAPWVEAPGKDGQGS